MFPFLLAVVAFLFIPLTRTFISSILFSKWNEVPDDVPAEQLAELDGGFWERTSVFEHIEQGLNKNPDGPAVVCTFQPADYLDGFLFREEKNKRQVTLWQQQNGDSTLCNGHVQLDINKVQRNNVLWKQQNGYSSLSNGQTQPTCLILTYIQLHRAALKLATGLLANGAQPNTTLVMLIPNGSEYAILLWTCILLRITYVSLDPSLLDISGFTALKHLLQMLKPQLVVAPDGLSGRALDVAVSELQLPQPIRLCLPSHSHAPIGGWKSLTDITIAASAQKCPGPIDESTLLTAARHDSPNRINSIMFTSGTSGLPKGCPQCVSAMSHVLHSQSWLINPNESNIIALQQAHNSRGIAPAQTLQTWRAGGAVVMTGQQFDVHAAVDAIRRFRVSFLVLTPPMVHEMAAALAERNSLLDGDAWSVRKIQLGGDAVTKDVLMKCATLFPQAEVCVNHGMTEGGGSFVWPFFQTRVQEIPFFGGEICPIGRVAPGSTIRIWDTERKCVVGRGQLGELHIQCASIIRHYLGGRSEESFYNDRKGRWFNTGDIAMVDDEGLVYILGRRKDMIKRAGVAIMPAAMESSIETFTGAQVSRPAPFSIQPTLLIYLY